MHERLLLRFIPNGSFARTFALSSLIEDDAASSTCHLDIDTGPQSFLKLFNPSYCTSEDASQGSVMVTFVPFGSSRSYVTFDVCGSGAYFKFLFYGP